MSPSTTRVTFAVCAGPEGSRLVGWSLDPPPLSSRYTTTASTTSDPILGRSANDRYGIRRTLESMISLICSTISIASAWLRCHTLRP